VDFQITHQKITQLIFELRSWEDHEEDRHTLNELAEMFDLDIHDVDRVAKSEGFVLLFVDPNATTTDLDPKELDQAIQAPDPDPTWKDHDTGVWSKNPTTGEWAQFNETIENDPDPD
jgi:hypothetical protein